MSSTKTPIEQRLATNVRSARKAMNLTQTGLGLLAGINLRYVQDIEAGRRNPSVGVVEGLRKALDCGWDDLLEHRKGPKKR